jgi:hypothetical protein
MSPADSPFDATPNMANHPSGEKTSTNSKPK